MNTASFRRKIAYIVVMLLLLLPLVWLGQPAAVSPDGQRAGAGLLANIRDEHKLDLASLGDIDPASSAIKMATFGVRSLACSLLRNQADEFKNRENWTALQATVDQLAKLQPYYISPWRYQAWNLSYNVSVEFDRYDARYEWVKEGIKFLLRGMKYNRKEHRLLSDIGWFTAQKIGRSDERAEFRRLFRADNDREYPDHEGTSLLYPHEPRTSDQRDNWLVAIEFYRQAEALLEEPDVSLGTVSPIVFYSYAPLSLINYAANLEEDGIFGTRAKQAWETALAAWDDFGEIEIPPSLAAPPGTIIKLGNAYYEQVTADRDMAVDELDALLPGLKEQVLAELLASLTDDERSLLERAQTDPESLREDEQFDARAVLLKTRIDHLGLAERAPVELRDQALEIARRATNLERLLVEIGRDRDQCQYSYWRLRCVMERDDDTLRARALMHEAERETEKETLVDLKLAKQKYDECFALWRTIMDRYPTMLRDDVSGWDLVDAIVNYQLVLENYPVAPGETPPPKFPEGFILRDLWEAQQRQAMATMDPSRMPQGMMPGNMPPGMESLTAPQLQPPQGN
jgi:hypothetical protein